MCPDAVAPDPFRGIYGMPMFVSPENTRVIVTAAKPGETGNSAAEDLAIIGNGVLGAPQNRRGSLIIGV